MDDRLLGIQLHSCHMLSRACFAAFRGSHASHIHAWSAAAPYAFAAA